MKKPDIPDFLNDESYKDLLDHAHDLIQIIDLEGRLLYANKSWTGLLEYSLEEIQGKSIYLFVMEEDRQRFKDYRTQIVNGSSNNKEIIIRFNTKSGKKLFLEGFSSLAFKDKRPHHTRGIFRDITSKLENEATLKEREYNLEQLLINAPDAVIVIDQNSLITYWNPQAEKMFGWKAHQVIDQSLSGTIIPRQHREAHDYGMKRYLATGDAHVLNKTVEITAINIRGEEFYISLSISSTSQNGKVAFIAFIRDIREQKKNETELEKKQMELEISNQQLEQFAHVASHDMKEPIRKIKTFSNLLESELGFLLTENGRKYLSKINSAADRLQSMVEGVLNFAIAGSIRDTFEDVDLNGILFDIENDLEVLIKQKKAVIAYEKLPELHGAQFLIYQLFYNLIYNSLKFSKETEQPVIAIRANEIDNPVINDNPDNTHTWRYIKVQLKDNGIGFNQQHASEIFKTFTRLHNRSRFEGTGLGLSLCKKIMDRHNGFIKAEGEEGVGATIIMLFPVQGR